MTAMQSSFADKISQILLIVFSVVLGLYLSERLEERKNEKEANQLLSKITAELRTNRDILDEWVPYHIQVIKTLDSFYRSDVFINEFSQDETKLYAAFTKGSIMSQTPRDDAWEIAKSHPLIVNLEYDQLLALSKIYNQQETTYMTFQNLIETLLSPDFNEGENAKKNILLLIRKLNDIASREMQLLHFYKEAEQVLSY